MRRAKAFAVKIKNQQSICRKKDLNDKKYELCNDDVCKQTLYGKKQMFPDQKREIIYLCYTFKPQLKNKLLLFSAFIDTICLRFSKPDMCFCGFITLLYTYTCENVNAPESLLVNGFLARDNVGNKANLTLQDPLTSSIDAVLCTQRTKQGVLLLLMQFT